MDGQYKMFTVLESKKQAVPRTLELVIRNIENNFDDLTENQLLVGVMYTLMLECGYTLKINDTDSEIDKGSNPKSMDDNDNVPSCMTLDQSLSFSYKQVLSQADWLSPHFLKASKVYKLPFQLIGVPEYLFLLMLIPSGNQSMLNFLIVENNCIIDCCAIALIPKSFVLTTSNGVPVACRFHDLKKLSILFKDEIALRGRSFVLNMLHSLNNSLEGMPEEILLKIMKYLPSNDKWNMANSCSTIYSKTSTAFFAKLKTSK